MHKIVNSDFKLDLVFNCISNIKIKNNSDTLILKYDFWHNVFFCWINTIISEYESFYFSNLILNKKYISLSFEITNNTEIEKLNEKWLSKSGPTDVLSFPLISEKDPLNNFSFVELGDLFISLDIAKEQSLKYNHSLTKEMLWLASHGFLHLLGLEHNDNNELDIMLNLQEYFISKLNYLSIFK